MAQRMTKEEEAELERLEALGAARKAGQKAYAQKKYEGASQHFSTAIELQSGDFKLHSMRSLCFLKLRKFQLCVGDAQIMINLKRKNPAGYHRKGLCHLQLREYALAYRTFQDGLLLNPGAPALVKGQRDAVAALRSGKVTQLTSTALLFSYYGPDGNVERGDRKRVHLDAAALAAEVGGESEPGAGPVDVSAEAELASYSCDMSRMVGALRDRRIEVFGHHATRIGGGSPEELARYIRNFSTSIRSTRTTSCTTPAAPKWEPATGLSPHRASPLPT
ncbi:uncharacterized protein AMSG_04433 [Thecamonas trahens ATCC 50062]|uniref:Uncharacterized protein n=1 Tax=Thecamonas trahens ATCC 50062 TaxID=461836 RepID=A0A0L0D781_THETB|nr:hypothetical protein AMSG_04433 [Thecamonas trahens ATCC 50062]KNC48204.1 hypothetical protein AMSG_04433 [Thecamonas trahens ATCC 50062]|eukprot:XP_013758773.1 hypothetical protein AMSG_04433 [Thecamonas trahens ATCC 50062]